MSLLLGLLLLPLSLSGCASRNAAPIGSAAPLVVFQVPGGQAVNVRVEVAQTDEDRSRGMMFRDHMENGTGMLFLFDREAQQVFWMKNTYVPLDMIFITGQKRVLGLVEQAEPLTTTPRMVEGASKFVLEVPGGFARAHGIRPGVPVEFVHVQ